MCYLQTLLQTVRLIDCPRRRIREHNTPILPKLAEEVGVVVSNFQEVVYYQLLPQLRKLDYLTSMRVLLD